MNPKSSERPAPHTRGIKPYRQFVGPARKAWIARVSWSPDGKSISAACKGGLFVWDVATAGLRFYVPLRAYHVYTGVWSPDGSQIACAADDGYVRLLDSEDGRFAREFEIVPRHSRGTSRGPSPGNKEDVRGVSWSPDGRYLACGTESGLVVWDIRKGTAAEVLEEATGIISALWSPDGEFIACTTYGSNVYV